MLSNNVDNWCYRKHFINFGVISIKIYVLWVIYDLISMMRAMYLYKDFNKLCTK